MSAAETDPAPPVVVIGVGDELRGDDAIGPRIAARLRGEPGVAVCCREGVDLLDAWASADAALVIDAMRSDAPPGTIIRIDALREPLPDRAPSRGIAHAVGVRDAIELARSLGRLPSALIVLAVAGEQFGIGAAASDAVEQALDSLLVTVRRELRELRLAYRAP